MRDTLESLIRSTDQSRDQVLTTMKEIFAAARPGVVYGEPLQVEGHTVITASEVVSGGGFGFGSGIGSGMAEEQAAEDGATTGSGAGGGGGGGGGSSARPVAVIVAGENGVEVQPIVDVTKIGLAALTASAAMVPILWRMARTSRS